jgi:NAD(P)H-hydrate epimerase
MVVDSEDGAMCEEVFEKASNLVVGPGLGRRAWGESLLEQALGLNKPVVLDADGLFLLARSGAVPSAGAIITPHTGEAATLLGTRTRTVEEDRIDAARQLAERVHGVAVLKGAGSVVAGESVSGTRCLGICAHGNPGMATAGMGDVLAGLIGGLLAQGLSSESAALTGVCLHSLAADRAVREKGEMSLLATDVLPEMISILRSAQRPVDSA